MESSIARPNAIAKYNYTTQNTFGSHVVVFLPCRSNLQLRLAGHIMSEIHYTHNRGRPNT